MCVCVCVCVRACVCVCVCVCVRTHAHAQSCLTLWDLVDGSPLGSSVHGIFQARILEWVAISSPRDQTWVSCISFISGQILYQLHHLGSPNSNSIWGDQILNFLKIFSAFSWLPKGTYLSDILFFPSRINAFLQCCLAFSMHCSHEKNWHHELIFIENPQGACCCACLFVRAPSIENRSAGSQPLPQLIWEQLQSSQSENQIPSGASKEPNSFFNPVN